MRCMASIDAFRYVRRFAVAGFLGVAVLTATAACGGGEPSSDASSSSTPSASDDSSGSASASETPSGSSSSSSTSTAPGARTVAEKFVKAYAKGQLPRDQWYKGVSPYCTDGLKKRLKNVSPGRSFPFSKLTGDPQPAKATKSGTKVFTVTTDGDTLVITMAKASGKWKASAVDYK